MLASPPAQPPWRELALLLLLAAIWSSSFMLIKVGVATVPPMTIAAGRLALAALMLVFFAVWSGHRIPMTFEAWGMFGFVGFFGNALPFTLIGWGEQRIDSGLAAILMGIMPVVTAVLAHFFTPGDRLSLRRIAGVAVGFSGLIALVGPKALAGLGGAVASQLAVLSGAISYAVTTIFVRRFVRLPGRVMAAGATTAGALLILPGSLWFERPWSLAPSTASVLAVVVLGILPTGVATLIYFRLVSSLGATVFSQVNYLIPVLGVVWGVALLGERPGLEAVTALTLILVGVALVSRRGRDS